MRKRALSSHGEHAAEENHLNLTPLIDVVFVLLIMFILIAPMLEVDHVVLANSAAHDDKEISEVQSSSPIAIHVREDNTIWFNSKKITATELAPLLKEAKKKYPQKIPQLFHDKKAHFGTYQAVKNAVEMAGYEQLDVILQPG